MSDFKAKMYQIRFRLGGREAEGKGRGKGGKREGEGKGGKEREKGGPPLQSTPPLLLKNPGYGPGPGPHSGRIERSTRLPSWI